MIIIIIIIIILIIIIIEIIIIVWISSTFDNNFRIENGFTKYLKESSC